MSIQSQRGMQDIMPQDNAEWRFIEENFRAVCDVFGYGEIRTPVLEDTDLFQRGVGDTTDVVQKEMYTFMDKGDRCVSLRPEGTASAARAYLQHNEYAKPQPIKYFYDIACYRYEAPQSGRLREFHQFGVEAFGGKNPAVDAEVIAIASTFFQRVGLQNVSLKLNTIGCPTCRKAYNELLTQKLTEHKEELCETCRDRLTRNPMRILDCKSPICSEIASGMPMLIDYVCDECRDHFEKVKQLLSGMGIAFEIDPMIVRGLDYYTKTVFEFKAEGLGSQSTVCGGGRYDGLVEIIGGDPSPGCGFGLGKERLLMALKAQNDNLPEAKMPDIYIGSMGEQGADAAAILCHKLRTQGVWAECDLVGRSVKAQMKYANKVGAKKSIILGDSEIEANEAVLKDMAGGENVTVSLNDMNTLVALVKGR